MNITPEKRFWLKVNKRGKCWLWLGGQNEDGYGIFSVGRRRMRAHRWIYQFLNGALPRSIEVCHICDNPRCVRPSHLFSGTHAANMKDSANKNRNGMQRHPHRSSLIGGEVQRPRGERNGASRLVEQDVIAIRHMKRSGLKRAQISKLYGVSKVTISKIITYQSWAHIK